jgi:hypothetical protein
MVSERQCATVWAWNATRNYGEMGSSLPTGSSELYYLSEVLMPSRAEIKRRSEDAKAARAFSRLGVEARMKKKTPEERSEQARRAAASRRDRQPKGPWYGLILYPKDYVWRGAKDAIKVLNEMYSNPKVVFWSQDKQEVLAKANGPQYRNRLSEVIEQDWDPRAFTLKRVFAPDADAARQALAGGQQ